MAGRFFRSGSPTLEQRAESLYGRYPGSNPGSGDIPGTVNYIAQALRLPMYTGLESDDAQWVVEDLN